MQECSWKRDRSAAEQHVRGIRGPAGKMLSAGVEHLGEPRELIEEVMFEHVMTRRMKLNSFLPFVAICAASAPAARLY